MLVEVRNNNVEKAMRILKKKLQEDGLFNELRKREYAMTKGEKALNLAKGKAVVSGAKAAKAAKEKAKANAEEEKRRKGERERDEASRGRGVVK